MKPRTGFIFAAALILSSQLIFSESPQVQDDPFIWLEEVESEASLKWVNEHNAITKSAFASDEQFQKMQKQALEIMNSQERIPYVQFEGKYLYNFWDDEKNVRGVLRRTTLDEYQKPNPSWEIVLDIDKLNKEEGKSWVYRSYTAFPPDYRYAMVKLSDGGKDATVVREFDLFEKKFIDRGYTLPEAKSSVDWYDYNTLILGTDFGPGSLTSSGYPRQVRLWKRGTPYSDAQLVFEGDTSDTWAYGSMDVRPEATIFTVGHSMSFWESEQWIVDDKMNRLKVPLPKDVSINAYFKDYVLATLNSEWLGIGEGTLIALKMSDFNAPDLKSKIEIVYAPTEKTFLSGVTVTKDYLVLNLLENVRGKLIYLEPQTKDGKNVWLGGELELPKFGTVGVSSADAFT
ncbi:MAG: S9 family peptidase, partial [Candidatus Zixiibacteriota bacterium]